MLEFNLGNRGLDQGVGQGAGQEVGLDQNQVVHKIQRADQEVGLNQEAGRGAEAVRGAEASQDQEVSPGLDQDQHHQRQNP